MVSFTLLSTALMGLLVAATFLAVARVGTQRTAPGADASSDRYDTVVNGLGGIVRKPVVWAVAFVVITVGVSGVALLAVGDFGLSEGLSGSLLTVSYVAVGLLVTGFVFLGAYFGARERGLGNAQGVAAGSLALGLVFLLLIAANLLARSVG